MSNAPGRSYRTGGKRARFLKEPWTRAIVYIDILLDMNRF